MFSIIKCKRVIAVAACGVAFASSSAHAGVFCPGLIDDGLNIAGSLFGGGPPDPGCLADRANAALGNPIRVPQASAAPRPAPMPLPAMPPLGNVCYSQVGPVAGPLNPIGSPCFVPTPWGPARGVVGR